MTRIISSVLLILIFFPILFLGGNAYAILMAIIGLMGLFELVHIREKKREFPFLMKVFAYLLTAFFILSNYQTVIFIYQLDYRVMSFIMFAFLAPLVLINDQKKYNVSDSLFLIGAVLFIGLSFNLLILTRNMGLYYALYLFIITISTDTFAYFIGKLVGKHQLSKISPKKTIEGLLGGVGMGTILSVIFYVTTIDSGISIFTISLVSLFLSLIGQLGDLVFSSIKRYFEQKDFSSIIPGHGGILDRLDSMIFVILAFIVVSSIL